MKKTALITGASSGIGMELARVHASKGDNLILVARSGTKLRDLKKELEAAHQISVHVFEKDLSLENAPKEIFEETQKLNIKVDYLINNAGFGDFGFFSETNWEKEKQMIDLNITALTQFCKLFLPEMIKNKSGKILNVASTAAFQPGPTMAIYFATKAYVLSFSEAIANEVSGSGVTVTALCPGATESGFMAAADMEGSALFSRFKLPTSKVVAAYGYKAMMKGQTVAIHGMMNYLLANTVRFAPRKLVAMISRKAIGG